MPQRIAVIGAGVLGLAVARSLASQGAQVTVFDKRYPGSGTSQISSGWINANGKDPASYHQLNAAAMDEHKRWQAEHPEPAPGRLETGTLEGPTHPTIHPQPEQRCGEPRALGYPAES